MKQKGISIFLPAYNEEENIEKAIISAENYAKRKFAKYEIIVVNDGSKDRTKEIVQRLEKKSPHIKLVNHNRNLGYGAAIRSGLKNASNDLIFYMDADNQFNINDLDKLLPLTKKYDIVSGYRLRRKDPFMRIITALVYNGIIRFLFNIQIKDIDASFKLYKKYVIRSIDLKSTTGFIDAEIFIKAREKGFTIGQIEVSHYPRAKGKTTYEIGKRNIFFALVKPQVVIGIFKEIMTLWPELR